MSLRGTTLLGRRMSCPAYPLFSPSRGADGSPTCVRVDAWRFQFAAGGVNSGRQPWRDLSAGGPRLLSAGDATAKPLRHCLGWNISTATRGAPVAHGVLVARCACDPARRAARSRHAIRSQRSQHAKRLRHTTCHAYAGSSHFDHASPSSPVKPQGTSSRALPRDSEEPAASMSRACNAALSDTRSRESSFAFRLLIGRPTPLARHEPI